MAKNACRKVLLFLCSVCHLHNRGFCILLRCIRPPQKASSDPIIFWKHQCGLREYNNFMKQIGSIIVILNHVGIFFGGHVNIFWLFRVFHVWEPIFFYFHHEKLAFNADYLMPYCKKSPLLTGPQFFFFNLEMMINTFFHVLW